MFYAFDLIGTAIFAITGALVARGKNIDLYGVVIFSIVTAIGGGTLRDLLLGRTPVFWIRDNNYIWVAVAAGLVTFMIARVGFIPRRTLLIGDALGLALFTIIGADVALAENTTPLIAVIMGTMTGTGGGITRDLLAGEIPLILRKEIYATASLAGAIVYVGWHSLAGTASLSVGISMLLVVILRLASIKYGGSLPLFLVKTEE